VGKDEYAGQGLGAQSSGTRAGFQPETPAKATISTFPRHDFHLSAETFSTFWLTTVIALVYFHSAIKCNRLLTTSCRALGPFLKTVTQSSQRAKAQMTVF
jgi:hypothetical protein